MNEKSNKQKKAIPSMADRRDFLKSGVAFTGAALLGVTFQPTAVCAANAPRPDIKDIEMLFVQNAQNSEIKDGRLVLVGVTPTTIFFSDRPKRIAGHMRTDDFVSDWQEGAGPESFHSDPPNATLSIMGEQEIVDVVMTLKNPRLSGGSLIYDINVQEQEGAIPSGAVSLFIDPVGMPLTATSVAGVRRRTRRRMVRRAAVLY